MKKAREIPWILNCLRLPARYTRWDVCDRLRIGAVDDVTKLVKAKMLRPLAPRKGRKQMWFFAEDIEELAQNRRWMEKMTRLLRDGEETTDDKRKE